MVVPLGLGSGLGQYDNIERKEIRRKTFCVAGGLRVGEQGKVPELES